MEQEDVLKSIGERFKKAREAKGLSIEQAYIKTHIHAKVICALEDGGIDNMMSLIYAKGFLKQYSGFLGLNGDEIIKEYLTVHSEHKEPPKEPLQEPRARPLTTIRSSAFRIPHNRYLYTFIVVLVLAVIFILMALLKPQHGSVRLKQDASPARRSKVPQQAVKTASQADVKVQKAASLPTVSIPKSEPIIVTVRVKRAVLVRAAEDDGVRFDSILKKDTVETLKAQDKISLRIGDLGAVDIFLNGKPLVIARKSGVRDLEITRHGIRIK